MTIIIKDLGIRAYAGAYQQMRQFNEQRRATTVDEIWLLEHPPVYTLGLSANEQHLLNKNPIPVVKTDRGGQVTYHGPGQLIIYLMLNLEKRPYRIKKLISLLEQSVIDYLQEYDIKAERQQGAPGVYIKGDKIAALGLRIRKKGTYHGLALNINMDLQPFDDINPCGYAGLRCTQLSNFISVISMNDVKRQLPDYLLKNLNHDADVCSE